ncbi:MAG: EamA family transporter [Deltaproteobacteria bacterium]|nr:EamA family transporter [Deltaproteobacteria bacterium]
MTNKQTLYTYTALTLAVIFWGFSFIATKIALENFPPFCLIFFRFAGASIFFIFLLMRTGIPTLTWKNLKPLLFIAIFQPGLYFSFETVGLQYSSATKVSLIIATIPIVVLFLSAIFLKERIKIINIAGIILSIFGVTLLVFGGRTPSGPGGELSGDLFVLGAVFSASIYMIMIRSLGKTFSPVQITAMQIIFGAILFFPAFLFTMPKIQWSTVTANAYSAVIALTIFSTIGAFLCYNYALTKIPATQAAVCLNAIPLITAGGAWLILGEQLTPIQFAGGAVVITAVYLANIPVSPHSRKDS